MEFFQLPLRLIFSLVLFAACSLSHATVIDQVNDPSTPNATYYIGAGYQWQQEVTVGVTGKLVGIALLMSNVTTTFFVNSGSGWQTDANDFSTTITGTDSNFSWYYIDLSSASLFFNAGDVFTFGSQSSIFSPNLPAFEGTSYDSYTAGSLFLNGTTQSGDFAFRTYIASVPESPGLVLLLISLYGLWMFGRKRRVR